MTFYDTIGTENIEFRYSSPTFTIGAIGGRDLSTSNPGYVAMQGHNGGNVVKIAVTANQTFIDDSGSSEIIGNLFGLTTSIAHADHIPFCVYAVLNDNADAISFMISRRFGQAASPATASIGAPDDAVADTLISFWSLENITETEWDNNPALPIGSFRMTMSASDDWTVQSLGSKDGIGRYGEGNLFAVSLAQFGAATGTYILANGGTAPVFSTNSYLYKIHKNGCVNAYYNFQLDGGTDGAGAVDTLMAMPYINSNITSHNIGTALVLAPGYTNIAMNFHDGTNTYFVREGGAGTAQNADFTNGNRILRGFYTIQM